MMVEFSAFHSHVLHPWKQSKEHGEAAAKRYRDTETCVSVSFSSVFFVLLSHQRQLHF